MKKVFSLIISCTLVLTLFNGCARKTSSQGQNGAPTEIKVMLFGDAPRDLDLVVDEFMKRTKNTLNIKPVFEWSSLADHKQKVKLRVAANEEMDLVFDAPFANLRELSSQGAYVDLEPYMNNDKYPGLKSAFPKDLLEANRFSNKIYALPVIGTYGTMDGIIYRDDLRVKYGLGEIKTEDDLKAYFDTVLANEKGMIPLAVDARRGFYNLFSPSSDDPRLKNVSSVSASGLAFNVAVDDNKKKVLGVVEGYSGDDTNLYQNFPIGFRDIYLSRLKKFVEWNKYLEKNSISQKDKAGLFNAGKAASVDSDLVNLPSISQSIKNVFPQATIGFFPYLESDRQLKPYTHRYGLRAGNYICIANSSTQKEECIKFLDWIFQSQENHDLFEYGIEGKHWVADGENGWKYPEGININSIYNFPGYEITCNPNLSRVFTETSGDTKKYGEYIQRKDTYMKEPDIFDGFILNTDNIKTEIAAVTPIYTDTLTALAHGILSDPEQEIKNVNQKAKAQGLEKIRTEVLKQTQEFLDKKNNK